MELMMGASFHCPRPDISNDKLVPVDVLSSNSSDVFTERDEKYNGADDEHPELNRDIVVQDGAWKSEQPLVNTWNVAKLAWKGEITATKIGTADKNAAKGVQDAMDVATLWSDAFGWDLMSENCLKNQVSPQEKIMPLVWDQFEELYMACPLVGVEA